MTDGPAAGNGSERVDSNVVVFIGADGIGRGEDELGWALMLAFLKALPDTEPRPRTVALMNSGVKLVAAGSEGVAPLAALEELGTEVLSCGTCLDYFELRERLGVGRASNMQEIAARLMAADHVVRP